MGKKKPFINKRNSATFQLLARDSAVGASSTAGESPATDRVFVRVDNNPYSVRGIEEDEDDELNDEIGSNSIFADAPEDVDDERSETRDALPDNVRREIIELGLPDDGYNYLNHLREIKFSGGGSTYYHNSKAKLDQLPLDVKAFDASRLRISDVSNELNDDSKLFSKVASKTVGVKVQRAVDPDVARLLDDSDLSRFGSDVEDLDEDFMVKANLPDGEEEEEEVIPGKNDTNLPKDTFLEEHDKFADCEEGDDEFEVSDKPRVRRYLDEQFDLLTLREYDTDSGDEDAEYTGTEDGPLAAKISDALKPYAMDDFKLGHKYRAPGDLDPDLHGPDVGPELDLSTDIIQKCVEYAEKYCNESQDDKDVVLVEESSDESEVWDCETIVSTYSNLDNHPGKIQAPQNPKRRVPKNIPGDSVMKDNVIMIGGKEKIPVEFLPQNKRSVEKVKAPVKPSGTDCQKRIPHGEESKEEKKERKAAVKEERREARRAKKELKVLYRCEAQKAQKIAAVAGPSSVHLM